MKVVTSNESPHLYQEWSSICWEIVAVREIIERHCSSMLPEDLFGALVSCAKIAAFVDFIPPDRTELIVASKKYDDHLDSIVSEIQDSWCDSEQYISQSMRKR